MRNKFEQLIEYIINDETEKANELFHSVVVEKSREIYNELVAEDMDDMGNEHGMSMDQTDDMMGDISADEEGMGHDDEEGDEMSFGDDDMGSEHDEGSMEDRVVDLEDALDDLKAEFERLMHDEAGEEEHEMPEEGVMREYVEKIGEPYKGEFTGGPRGQNVGANTGDHENSGEKNTKSVVAGKNDMGGTVKNLVQGGTNEDPDGKQYKKPSNAYAKGDGKFGPAKYENSPGGNAGKSFSGAKKPVTSEPAGVNKKPIVAK
jgi:hypothetical protein